MACMMLANEAAILRIRRSSHTANPNPVSLWSQTEARMRASRTVTARNTAPHGHIPDQDGPTHDGDVGADIGENGGDFRPDACEAPVTRALLPGRSDRPLVLGIGLVDRTDGWV